MQCKALMVRIKFKTLLQPEYSIHQGDGSSGYRKRLLGHFRLDTVVPDWLPDFIDQCVWRHANELSVPCQPPTLSSSSSSQPPSLFYLYYYYVCCLLAGPLISGRFLPYVRLINCRFPSISIFSVFL